MELNTRKLFKGVRFSRSKLGQTLDIEVSRAEVTWTMHNITVLHEDLPKGRLTFKLSTVDQLRKVEDGKSINLICKKQRLSFAMATTGEREEFKKFLLRAKHWASGSPESAEGGAVPPPAASGPKRSRTAGGSASGAFEPLDNISEKKPRRPPALPPSTGSSGGLWRRDRPTPTAGTLAADVIAAKSGKIGENLSSRNVVPTTPTTGTRRGEVALPFPRAAAGAGKGRAQGAASWQAVAAAGGRGGGDYYSERKRVLQQQGGVLCRAGIGSDKENSSGYGSGNEDEDSEVLMVESPPRNAKGPLARIIREGGKKTANLHYYRRHTNDREALARSERAGGLRNLGNTCYMNAAVQALLGLARYVDDVQCVHWVRAVLAGEAEEPPPPQQLLQPAAAGAAAGAAAAAAAGAAAAGAAGAAAAADSAAARSALPAAASSAAAATVPEAAASAAQPVSDAAVGLGAKAAAAGDKTADAPMIIDLGGDSPASATSRGNGAVVAAAGASSAPAAQASMYRALLQLSLAARASSGGSGAIDGGPASQPDPAVLKRAVDRHTDSFVGNLQQDAHEFLTDLVSTLHEELEPFLPAVQRRIAAAAADKAANDTTATAGAAAPTGAKSPDAGTIGDNSAKAEAASSAGATSGKPTCMIAAADEAAAAVADAPDAGASSGQEQHRQLGEGLEGAPSHQNGIGGGGIPALLAVSTPLPAPSASGGIGLGEGFSLPMQALASSTPAAATQGDSFSAEQKDEGAFVTPVETRTRPLPQEQQQTPSVSPVLKLVAAAAAAGGADAGEGSVLQSEGAEETEKGGEAVAAAAVAADGEDAAAAAARGEQEAAAAKAAAAKAKAKLCRELLPTGRSFHAEVDVTLTCSCCGYARVRTEFYRDFSLDLEDAIALAAAGDASAAAAAAASSGGRNGAVSAAAAAKAAALSNVAPAAGGMKPGVASAAAAAPAANWLQQHQQPVAMARLLEGFFRPRELSLRCERCQSQRVQAAYAFGALPAVLVLHIKRFRYEPKRGRHVKLCTPVAVPSVLGLEAFCGESTANPPRLAPMGPRCEGAAAQEATRRLQAAEADAAALPLPPAPAAAAAAASADVGAGALPPLPSLPMRPVNFRETLLSPAAAAAGGGAALAKDLRPIVRDGPPCPRKKSAGTRICQQAAAVIEEDSDEASAMAEDFRAAESYDFSSSKTVRDAAAGNPYQPTPQRPPLAPASRDKMVVLGGQPSFGNGVYGGSYNDGGFNGYGSVGLGSGIGGGSGGGSSGGAFGTSGGAFGSRGNGGFGGSDGGGGSGGGGGASAGSESGYRKRARDITQKRRDKEAQKAEEERDGWEPIPAASGVIRTSWGNKRQLDGYSGRCDGGSGYSGAAAAAHAGNSSVHNLDGGGGGGTRGDAEEQRQLQEAIEVSAREAAQAYEEAPFDSCRSTPPRRNNYGGEYFGNDASAVMAPPVLTTPPTSGSRGGGGGSGGIDVLAKAAAEAAIHGEDQRRQEQADVEEAMRRSLATDKDCSATAAAVAAGQLPVAAMPWSCEACTYYNEDGVRTQCAICETERPTGVEDMEDAGTAGAAGAAGATAAAAASGGAAPAAAGAAGDAAAASNAAAAAAAAADNDTDTGLAPMDVVDDGDAAEINAAAENNAAAPTSSSPEPAESDEAAAEPRPPREEPLQARYRLQAVLHHLGPHAFAGHYVTDVREPEEEQERTKGAVALWKSFDDSVVRTVPESAVLGPDRQQACYICFYVAT